MVLINPTIYNTTMIDANTEYSQALPTGTKLVEIRCQTAFAIRYAFETGKVATPTAPYRTLDAGSVKTIENLYLTGEILYFACGTSGKVIEIEVWT